MNTSAKTSTCFLIHHLTFRDTVCIKFEQKNTDSLTLKFSEALPILRRNCHEPLTHFGSAWGWG